MMRGAIFNIKEINLWQKTLQEFFELNLTVADKYSTKAHLNYILQTIKSYKLHPNGNGIKWSKEEKEEFVKLSYKEQRKMIVRKSELRSALFPYVTVDYEPYKYSERISDSAKRAYQKANFLLDENTDLDFTSLDHKIKQEIFRNLRLAYKERYLKAGVELAKLLFKNSHLRAHSDAGNEKAECASITKALLDEKIPENAYMYYQLYKDWQPGFNEEQALECYNFALESIVWEAIDEETQREEFKKSAIAAELWIAAAIKYQSPLAFSKAASNYQPQGRYATYYAAIPYMACVRCAIALGNDGWIEEMAKDYGCCSTLHKSDLNARKLWAYLKKTPIQKGLINGLDPYFDEKFPPDLIIDFTYYVIACVYGGNKNFLGLEYAIQKEGLIKDPRDKDSTTQSIKEYYLMAWRIIVEYYKQHFDYDHRTSKNIQYLHIWQLNRCLLYKIYQNLPYGYPSARPYIFPKEVLDLEIDFTKGTKELIKP